MQPGEARPSDRSLSVYTANVRGQLSHGLGAILQDAGQLYDIIALTETWLPEDATPPELEGYDALNLPRPRRLQKKGSSRGGICVYIKHCSGLKVATTCAEQHGYFLSLRLTFAPQPCTIPFASLQLFCCYFSPDDGRVLSPEQVTRLWGFFSEEVAEAVGKGHALVVGDLNARTAALPDHPPVGSDMSGMEELFSLDRPPVCSVRKSADQGKVNKAGRRLLGMCKRTNMRIANGRKPGDEHGAVTYVSSGGGASLVDYVLASPALMPLIPDLRVLPAPSSDHHAILFHIRLSAPPPAPAPTAPQCAADLTLPARMKGAKEIAAWADHLKTAPVKAQVATLTKLAAEVPGGLAALQDLCRQFDVLVEDTWSDATSAISSRKAARVLRRPQTGLPQPKWWTPELTWKRRQMRRALRSQPRSEATLQLRRAYHSLLRRTCRAWEQQFGANLVRLWTEDPNRFWQTFKARKKGSVPISKLEQHLHFSALFSSAPDAADHPIADASAAARPQPSAAPSHSAAQPSSTPPYQSPSPSQQPSQPPQPPSSPSQPSPEPPPPPSAAAAPQPTAAPAPPSLPSSPPTLAPAPASATQQQQATSPEPPSRERPLPPRAPLVSSAPLDEPFSVDEVLTSIAKLKNGKSTVGQLSTEALQLAAPQLAAYIATLFNACVAAGSLPTFWALCTITAVHKGGDAADINNYRGIAVGSLLAKLYASVLTARLDKWTEENNLRSRSQAGFRKDFRTADQVLVLRTMIEKARLDSIPLYVCYVDFKKAYDSVPRDLLWRKLQQRLGIGDTAMQALKALYAEVPMAVSTAEGLGPVFQSHLGLKQGCPLSPLLFGLYVDDLEQELAKIGSTASFPVLSGNDVVAVMYADDLGLAAEDAAGLQRQLDQLRAYAATWGLTVNVKKTKVVVYKALNTTCPPHTLTYDGVEVEQLEAFSYLGVQLHAHRRMAHAIDIKVESGTRAAHMFFAQCREMHITDPVALIELFRAIVLPIVQYGHEVWAPSMLCMAHPDNNPADTLWRWVLRRVLGLRAGTPNDVLLVEAGQLPCRIDFIVSLAKYWNRLVSMRGDRLVKDAFLESIKLMPHCSKPHSVKASWATQVVSLLSPVADPLTADGKPQRVNVKSVRDNLHKAFLQSVSDSRSSMTLSYLKITGALNCATYGPAVHLQAVQHNRCRRALTQLRTGSHWLRIATALWAPGKPLERHERLCRRCDRGEVDDLFHMVWNCPALLPQRFAHAALYSSMPADATEQQFLQQPDQQLLASFALACRKECRRLEHDN